MAEWKRLTIPDGGGTIWVNLDRVRYIAENKDTLIGMSTTLHFDQGPSLQVKESGSQIIENPADRQRGK